MVAEMLKKEEEVGHSRSSSEEKKAVSSSIAFVKTNSFCIRYYALEHAAISPKAPSPTALPFSIRSSLLPSIILPFANLYASSYLTSIPHTSPVEHQHKIAQERIRKKKTATKVKPNWLNPEADRRSVKRRTREKKLEKANKEYRKAYQAYKENYDPKAQPLSIRAFTHRDNVVYTPGVLMAQPSQERLSKVNNGLRKPRSILSVLTLSGWPSWGWPLHAFQVKFMAEGICRKRGDMELIGRNWAQKSIGQQNNMKTCFSSTIEHDRFLTHAPKTIKHFFFPYKYIRAMYDIQPETTWDMSEKGYDTSHYGHC